MSKNTKRSSFEPTSGPAQPVGATAQASVIEPARWGGLRAFVFARALDDATYRAVTVLLLSIYGCFAALSLAVSQLVVVLAIVYSAVWIVGRRSRATGSSDQIIDAYHPSESSAVATPTLLFCAAFIIAGFLGLGSSKSVFDGLTFGLYALFPICIARAASLVQKPGGASGSAEAQLCWSLRTVHVLIGSVLAGQSLAALHTLLRDGLELPIPQWIPGAVTESGQLVIVIPLVLAYCLLDPNRDADGTPSTGPHDSAPARSRNVRAHDISVGALLFGAGLTGSWYREQLLHSSSVLVPIAAYTFLGGLLVPGIVQIFRRGVTFARAAIPSANAATSDVVLHLSSLCRATLPLLLLALFINLKRGPWLGVLVSVFLITLLSRRVRWLVAASVLCGLLLTLSPSQRRIRQFGEHFEISGGRKTMWELGLQLVERYPLGLGPRNAAFMRQLDPTLPALHRHMHNNFLNVTVEAGWLGLAFYCWWMGAAIALGVKLWRSARSHRIAGQIERPLVPILALCMSGSLLGWQIAGLVEYNFGDGEVRLLAFLVMGLLLTLASLYRSSSLTSSPLTSSTDIRSQSR